MRIKEGVKTIALNGLLAALYFSLSLISPFSFGVLNLRVSDTIQVVGCMNKRLHAGIAMGMIVTNFFSPYGFTDVLAAIIICTVSFYFGWYIRHEIARVVLLVLTTALVVAAEITFIEGVPFIWMLISMTLSESLMSILGYTAIKALQRRKR